MTGQTRAQLQARLAAQTALIDRTTAALAEERERVSLAADAAVEWEVRARIAQADPGLVRILRMLGDEFGPKGVAQIATLLASSVSEEPPASEPTDS